MKTLSIDIETYSDVPLPKTGVYRYCESPDFEILLFGYSVDSGPVQVVDLACGEKIPEKIVAALEDETIIKWAFNAFFERICLSMFLGYPTGEYLDPESRCPSRHLPPFRVFTASSSTGISTRISMRSERQSETVMRIPLTSICSLLRCSRISPTSWPSTQTIPSLTAQRSGWMNSAPFPSTRCFRRLSSCGA